ncbi:protein hob1 [Colletotrichum spaethianum]|uniref:Protein hob1 n=1 Tax=Colletotrichum spaethianum TaxID=700344 RepID=A0AA37PAU1_9PEZI|nr:protein hob1 [Colletotrichum spaethianum]GKT48817.1 protein hob1 [Colletotrichum spaethianum]
MRIPSTTSLNRSAFTSDDSPQPSPQPSTLGQPQGASSVLPAYTSSRTEYFGHQSELASDHRNAVAKKKPPPPPPAKRSKAPEEYVVAQYDFLGGDGDLSFREGDRIKIVKRTETDQDWWIGELGGVKGSFPANYCKTA